MLDEPTRSRFQSQAAMLANRVKKRLKHLHKRFAREGIDVFRLYDGDIPEIRAAVDWYAGHLVLAEYMRRQSVPEWLPMMGSAVGSALGVPEENVHLKNRWTGCRQGKRYERLARTDRKIAVRERDLRFWVNLWDFVDTGLFADHRDTRQLVRAAAGGTDVLKLYCYTGTFSCYAARGGARSTVSVDRSRTALDWARENMALNGIALDVHRLVPSGTLAFLETAQREGGRFDLAVVDPPSYSTTRDGRRDFDIDRDHPALLTAVLRVMRPQGVVFFSTNHQNFTPRLETLALSGGEEITAFTIPEDYRQKTKRIHRCWKLVV